MEMGALGFSLWWCLTLVVLGIATLFATRARIEVGFEQVWLVFLVGVAAGLALYVAPRGLESVRSTGGLELRFLCALGISWLAAMRALPAGCGPAGCSTLAVAGFAGVSAPLVAFAASSLMVCGAGHPGCAL